MTDWDQYLCLAQFAINNAWHEAVQQAPFFLNHGRAAKTPLDILLPWREDVDNPASCKFAENLQRLVAREQKLTIAAQQRHKLYYDTKHAPAVFAVNDEVLLSTTGLNLKISGTNKLAPKWVGPFLVLERIGAVAYKLDLPETMKNYNIFHVFLLKAYNRDNRIALPPPPEVIDDEPQWEVYKTQRHNALLIHMLRVTTCLAACS